MTQPSVGDRRLPQNHGRLELSVPMRNLFSTEAEERTLAEVEFNAGEIVLGGSAAPRETEAPVSTQAASE